MRHFYRLFLLSAALFFLPRPAQACSCFWIETFCDYVQEDPQFDFYPRIIRGEVLDYYNYPLDTLIDGWVWQAPLVNIYVKEIIYGEAIGSDTITLYGQDGLNCSAPLGWLGGHTSFVFYVPSIDPEGRYLWSGEQPRVTNHPLGELPGCGPGFLKLVDDQLQGPLYPDIGQMSLQEFRDEINNCVGFTAAEEPEALQELQVFPNPVVDQLYVRHAPAEVQQLQLFDLHGRLIREISTPAGLIAEHELAVNELPAGVYMLTLSSNGRRVTRRIVKH